MSDYPNTVRELSLLSHTVFIVGEHHQKSESKQLTENVLEAESPDIIAIESCPERYDFYSDSGYQSTNGTLLAENYARTHSVPLYLIDILKEDTLLKLNLVTSVENMSEKPPEFDESLITDDGGLTDISEITNYLNTHKEYNQDRYEFIWEERERYMATTLLQKLQELPENSTVVVIVGLSHILQLEDFLQEEAESLPDVDTRLVEERTVNP